MGKREFVITVAKEILLECIKSGTVFASDGMPDNLIEHFDKVAKAVEKAWDNINPAG